eukprot:2924591-Pleurochrysis_carterae.AAC.1
MQSGASANKIDESPTETTNRARFRYTLFDELPVLVAANTILKAWPKFRAFRMNTIEMKVVLCLSNVINLEENVGKNATSQSDAHKHVFYIGAENIASASYRTKHIIRAKCLHICVTNRIMGEICTLRLRPLYLSEGSVSSSRTRLKRTHNGNAWG